MRWTSRVKRVAAKLGRLRRYVSPRTLFWLSLRVAGSLSSSIRGRVPRVGLSSDQLGLDSFIPGSRKSDSSSAESIETPDDPTDCGVIYARVSSKKQAEEGESLEEQVRNLKRVAENRDIELITDPIKDGGETGTDFDRPGIRLVREIAHRGDIEYVLVDDIDRVGRHPAETLYYLYELRSEFGVKVVTSESGELDVEDFEGLVHVVMKSLSAQIANENRARRAHASSVERFKQKNWSVYYNHAPLGYEVTEEDWLGVDEEDAEIVEEAFQTFLRVDRKSPYSKTVERVDGLPDEMSSSQLRGLLENPVYIGEPSVNTNPPGEEEATRVVVPDGGLQIVSDSAYERVQEKIGVVEDRYSTGSGEPMDIDDCVEKFGYRAVKENSPIVEVKCPDCGDELVKNGQRKLTEQTVHNYKCTNKDCGRQRTFPTQAELERMNRQNQDEEGNSEEEDRE